MFCGTLWCWTDEGGMATLWAAVITSVPALVAIYFAYRVGKNQVDIAKAAHLLEQQRVRAELYEKRSEIFGAGRRFINSILLTGHVPGRNPEDELGAQIDQDFKEAMGAAEFLFDRNVAELMDRIHTTAINFHVDHTIIRSKSIVDEAIIRTKAMGDFTRLSQQLTEAVRPYLTIDGRGEVPKV